MGALLVILCSSMALADLWPADEQQRAAATEQHLARLTREERAGLPPLAWDEDLAAIAREYSARMARDHFVSHIDPDGATPQDRVAWGHRTLAGPVAENLWMWRDRRREPALIARAAMDSWVSSAGHRRNLFGAHTHFAVGVHVDQDRAYVTQLFARAVVRLAKPVPRCMSAATPVELDLPPDSPIDYVDRLHVGSAAPSFRQPVHGRPALGGAEPGAYRLRFWVRRAPGSWTIVPGPMILWQATGSCPLDREP